VITVEMYNGLVICDRGFEKECSEEIKELTVVSDLRIGESFVTFGVNERQDLLMLCYRMQTAVKVLELLGACPFKAETIIADCTKFISQKEIMSPWVGLGRSFKIMTRFDQADTGLDSQQIATQVGSAVYSQFPGVKVDVKTPQTIICIYIIADTLFVGIDYSHENLAKREYKIFLNPTAIRATVGAALVRASGFNSRKTLLDPFNGTGTIAIEAGFLVMQQSPLFYKKEYLPIASYPFFTEAQTIAFFENLDSQRIVGSSSKSIFGYDIISKHVDSSKKNAKIAGVLDVIHFARVEVDWIDLKLPEDGIDCIVSVPPAYRDAVEKDSIDKVYKQLFHRAKEIVSTNGVIILLVNQPNTVKSLIPPELFECVEVRPVWMGHTSLFMLKIVRKK